MVEKAKEEKRKKVLVTGSSGMLGSDLCEELSRDYEIVGLDKLTPYGSACSPSLEPSRAKSRDALRLTTFIQCDIRDKNKTIKAIIDAKTDLIIHAAAWTDVDGCETNSDKAEKINVNGTENVVLSAGDLDIPLVYISTDFVFDGDKKSPYTEKDRPNPICIYGKSKLEGEKRVRSLNKYIILRTSWLYGANGKNFVDTILEKARSGETLRVVDDQIGTPTYTKDLAKAIRRIVDAAISYQQPKAESRKHYHRWGVYHISNKGEVSWFGYAKEILKIAAIDNVEVLSIKSSELDRSARRPVFSVLDNAKFEEAFGFNMRQWQESLQEYLHEKR